MKSWFGLAGWLIAGLAFSQQGAEVDDGDVVPESIEVRTKEGARFLKKPKDGARLLIEMPEGRILRASDARGLFLMVEYEGRTGWIHASQLGFDRHGVAFVEAKNRNRAGGTRYEDRRRRMSGGKKGSGKADLQQCAHVDGSGHRCHYMTGDDSGYCPEHKH